MYIFCLVCGCGPVVDGLTVYGGYGSPTNM